MACHVCPWWVGYLLVNPLRRLAQDPRKILAPFVRPGHHVLEIGPGMGFFTLDLARLAGPAGRIVAIDLQPRMLDRLRRRAEKAGLRDRIETRQVANDRMGVDDLAGKVDFVLAFAVVHELPDAAGFFREVHRVLKPGGRLLVAEPRGHVTESAFAATIADAESAGLAVDDRPAIGRSRSASFTKS